ncbi:MAG: DNA repair protein RadC [Candidatus Hydrogenedentes bacterium]|nr:DNA repair protein RadC [Candidatus Hydrogenedentota bacterium]
MAEGTYHSTAVRDMFEDDRPRERLAKAGPAALKDYELIAILFRTGTRECGAHVLAQRLLQHFGGLRALARASLEEIQQVKGVGRVKSIEIKAALELGMRLANHNRPQTDRIEKVEDVANLLMHQFKEYETEHFKAVLLNTKNEVLKVIEVSHGGLDGTEAAPRDVLRQAVREGAPAIIVAHNHPSGDPEPSRADIALTRRLAEAAGIVGVALLDHVVFGDGRVVSLKERGLM